MGWRNTASSCKAKISQGKKIAGCRPDRRFSRGRFHAKPQRHCAAVELSDSDHSLPTPPNRAAVSMLPANNARSACVIP
jgi:hypothetical protein